MKALHHAMSTSFGRAFSDVGAVLVMVVDDIAHDEEQPHCVVYKIENDTAYDLGAFSFDGIAADHDPENDAIIVIGYWGEIALLRPGMDPIFSQVPATRGPMRDIKKVGGQYICVGTNLQVFQSRDGVEWNDIGPTDTLRSLHPKQHLERFDGFSEVDLYAGGSDGVIWRFDGDRWNAIQCQTNARLLDVTCASDGEVYISGEFGTVCKGRRDTFEFLAGNPKLTNLWSVEHFAGKVYAAGMSALLTLTDTQLEPDLNAMRLANSFYDLSSAGNTLWSFGAKDTLFFRNGAWERLNDIVIV